MVRNFTIICETNGCFHGHYRSVAILESSKMLIHDSSIFETFW